MNMIASAKVSIVDPTPGVTRDRVTAIVDLDPPVHGGHVKTVEFVDTGGFGVYVTEGNRFDEVGNDLAKLTDSIEFQIAQAVGDADVVLFAVDAQAGVTPSDLEIARMLREGNYARGRSGKRVAAGAKKAERSRGEKGAKSSGPKKRGPVIRVVATKVDGPKWEAHAHEMAGMGFGDPLPVSAKNNYFRRDFMEAVWDLVPEAGDEDRERVRADLMIAIIGKRNAGKSTLVNTVAGEQRVIASEIPGTTRDAVDVLIHQKARAGRGEDDAGHEARSFVVIDTAGLRRKRSFQNPIEHFAFDRLQRAVDRSDVVLVLLDATERISQVDEQLAMLAQKAYKPTIIVVNKWDLVVGRRNDKGQLVTTKMYETYVRDQLRGLWFAPIAFVTATNGMNVLNTIDLAFELKTQSSARVTTGKLNRMIRAILDTRGPADERGRFAKVYYVAQTGVEPPTITMVVNHPDMFRANYIRFLMNRFREELPFTEVPMRIVVRARRQQEDDLLAAAEGGDDATIRIAKGRKGVKKRVGGRRVESTEDLGDRWLDDVNSEPVELETLSDDAADYFDDDPGGKAPAAPKNQAPEKKSHRRGPRQGSH